MREHMPPLYIHGRFKGLHHHPSIALSSTNSSNQYLQMTRKMAQQKEVTNKVEWKIKVADGSSKDLVPESEPAGRAWLGIQGLIAGLVLKVVKFFKKAWGIAVDDPRKVIHCLKVGMALTVVSLFYYMRPLYEGVGRNAMWAVMTTVVVFENSVGATLCKSLNRACGTLLAGSLAVGVHWVANQSGETLEPYVNGTSVFLLACAATFSRFIPTVRARFDYGAMIFVLTFSLISISGYRVEKLLRMARLRLSTIALGGSMCILISILVCPIWAGKELHLLITRNMDKLAYSLDGCVAEYFNNSGIPVEKLQGYKCVLNSKGTEESMANFARWEPAHGHFKFKHPWRQYLKLGASMRRCAYCIEALSCCINSENQVPESIKQHLSGICLRLGSVSSTVIRELAITMKTMKKSPKIKHLVREMKNSVQELHNEMGSLPYLPAPPSSTEKILPLVEVIPLATVASLLTEVAARIEDIAGATEELAKLAKFKPAVEKIPPH